MSVAGVSGLGADLGLAVLPDQSRHVVVRVDVADRPGDVGRLFPPVGSHPDGCVQPVRAVLDGICGGFERLAHVVIHVSQCLTFKNYGHEPILRYGSVI